MTSAISLSHSAQLSMRAKRDKGDLSARELEEFNEMREEMVRQKGLLNVIQAETYLEVSRERIYELMELNILRRFDSSAAFIFRLRKFKNVQRRDTGRQAKGIGRTESGYFHQRCSSD